MMSAGSKCCYYATKAWEHCSSFGLCFYCGFGHIGVDDDDDLDYDDDDDDD